MRARSRVAQKSGSAGRRRYTVYFEPQMDGSYHVVFPAIPEIITFGRSLNEARRMATDALRCHLEGLLKDGAKLPPERRPRGRLRKEELLLAL